MKETWVKSLEGRREFLESLSPKLRHGRKFVAVADIASQMYCEQKVEMKLLKGDIDNAAKAKGRELHDELIKTQKATTNAIIKGIRSGKQYGCVFSLAAEVDGLPILGKPDLVLFFNRTPISVIDLKTTRREDGRVWPNERLQLQTYGLLLHQMGFDTSSLSLAVAKNWGTVPKPLFMKQVVKEISDIILGKGSPSKWVVRSLDSGNLSLFAFDFEKAHKDVQWAKEYWLSKRDPIPTKNENKCRKCEYAATYDKQCGSSLQSNLGTWT